MQNLAFDAGRKGRFATVEKLLTVAGIADDQPGAPYWVAAVSTKIGDGAPTWVEIKMTKSKGDHLIPIGFVSPAAELDGMLGSQSGGIALLSSGDLWMNGQLKQRGFKQFRSSDVRAKRASKTPPVGRA